MSADDEHRNSASTDARKPWEPMRLEHLGDVGELLLAGEGKISGFDPSDPGEATKKAPSVLG